MIIASYRRAGEVRQGSFALEERREALEGSPAMTGLPYAVTLATALGCGLVAGVFFAFSTFVMPALRRLPAAEGVGAMQSINRLAVTPAFMTALFGTALAALGLIAWAAFTSAERPAALIIAGARCTSWARSA